MWKFLILTFLILNIAISIYIPISGKQKRCMIVYSVGQSETVKLDINFPQISDMQNYENFLISWENTETNNITKQLVKSGRFRRQLSLTPNVIYDLCIQSQVNRDYGVVYIEYSATNLFSVNQAEIKVPENILKSKDVTDAFMNTQNIQKTLGSFQNMQQNRSKTHSQIFRKTNLISQKLVQISLCQLIVVIIAGCWQFWTLYKYLKRKNYI